jgi:cytoskeletal protein CcmA (bactofilin family)
MQMFSNPRKVEPGMPSMESEKTPSIPERSNGDTGSAHPTGILSTGVSIKGSVSFRTELLIDGEVEGEISSSGRLTVGKNAQIRGQIRAKSVIVDGTVEGNIVAAERCQLRAGCTLRGDIEAPRLVVDEAATFLGSAKISTKAKPQS